jgi:hypothetical protein
LSCLQTQTVRVHLVQLNLNHVRAKMKRFQVFRPLYHNSLM